MRASEARLKLRTSREGEGSIYLQRNGRKHPFQKPALIHWGGPVINEGDRGPREQQFWGNRLLSMAASGVGITCD